MDELFDRWEAAWSRRAGAVFSDLCAPDLHYEDPLTAPPLHGPAELTAHARRLWTGFPDVRLERTGQRLSDGRFAVAPCRLMGTHLGELEGLPASGRALVMHGVFYCQLEPHQDRLWRVRAFFDVYGAAVDLGVLPRPGTVGERALMVLRGYGLRGRRSGS